jgi:hypothetical protein
MNTRIFSKLLLNKPEISIDKTDYGLMQIIFIMSIILDAILIIFVESEKYFFKLNRRMFSFL